MLLLNKDDSNIKRLKTILDKIDTIKINEIKKTEIKRSSRCHDMGNI